MARTTTKVGFDKRFDEGVGRFVKKLEALAGDVPRFVEEVLAETAETARARAAELTPRSDGPGPHVADAWVVERKDRGNKIRFVVRNSDREANASVVLADGTRQPYSLLHILEHGSAPHEIRPVRTPFLRFFWKRFGKTVEATLVNHPGTRPYAMIGIASIEAAVDLKEAIDAIRARIRLGGNQARARFFNPNRTE